MTLASPMMAWYKSAMTSVSPLSSMVPAGSASPLEAYGTEEVGVSAGTEDEYEWDVYVVEEEVVLVVEGALDVFGVLVLEELEGGGGDGVLEVVCGVGEGVFWWWEEEGGGL